MKLVAALSCQEARPMFVEELRHKIGSFLKIILLMIKIKKLNR